MVVLFFFLMATLIVIFIVIMIIIMVMVFCFLLVTLIVVFTIVWWSCGHAFVFFVGDIDHGHVFFSLGDPHRGRAFLCVSIQTFVLNPYIWLFSYVIILPCHVGRYHDLASYFLLCILNPWTLPPFMYWSSNWRCCKCVAMHLLGCCQAIICCIVILWAFTM